MHALVLGQLADSTANALTRALQQRGAFAVERATLDDLAGARWQHALTPRGVVATTRRARGAGTGAPDVVFNRLTAAVPAHFNRWSFTDRQYAYSELHAFFLSWLKSLGDRVVNRPMGGSLIGPMDKPWLWLARARQAGLPLHPSGATTSTRRLPPPADTLERCELLPAPALSSINRAAGYAARPEALIDVLVVGDRVIHGEGARSAHAGCLRLAQLARTDVLSVRLSRLPNDAALYFVDANPAPAIEDDESIEAVAVLLERRARGAS